MKPETTANLPKNFESRVQDLIYNVDVGLGSQLIKGAVYIALILTIMSIYWLSEFWGLKHADAMDQAQIARQLMTTGSFTTKYIRPAAVWMFENHGADPRTLMVTQPDIVHPPLHPWMLSWTFRLIGDSFTPGQQVRAFPPEQWAIVPLGHLCTLLTGFMLFLIGRRFFERRIALISTTIFFVTDSVWANSISGLGISLAVLLATSALYYGLVTAEKINAGAPARAWAPMFAITAVMCALALLTRYSAAWILVVVGLTLALLVPHKGWKLSLGLVAAVLLLVAPWFIRNAMVCGSPFGLTPYLALNADDGTITHSFERQVKPTLEGIRLVLNAKWMANMGRLYQETLPFMGGGLILAFFAVSYFFRFSREHIHVVRLGVLAAMIGLLVVGGFFGEETMRTFAIFWPVVILYGLSFFYLLLDRMQVTIPIVRAGIIGLVVTLSALPMIITLLPPRAGYPYPPYYPSYITLVTPMMKTDELLCTDMPWATAWYGDRSSVLLPATIEEFYKINDIQKRISGIYFTTLTRDLPFVRVLNTGPLSSWFPIFRDMIPMDFPLPEAFFINNRDQLFLTDRPRWLQR